MNWLAEALHGHFVLEAIGPMGCTHEKDSDEQHVADFVIEQLRTNEAVERLALFLLDDEGYDTSNGWPSNEQLGGGPTGDRDTEFKDAWMDHTRAAITALLGDSDNE